MKKKYSLPLLMASIFAITGCNQNQNTTVNKAPSITGVKDFKCIVNTTIDFLDGVAALDKEDGDITPDMDITISNGVTVEDGFATFDKAGSYTVTYQVEDSQGRRSQKICYVDVITRDEYRTFELAEGFSYKVSPNASVTKCGMINGNFKLIANGGNVPEDIELTRTFQAVTGKEYTYKFTVESSKAGRLLAKANGELCAEIYVKEGTNEIAFRYTAKKGLVEENEDVDISLCVGDLADEFEWTIKKVETLYPQEEGKIADLTGNFSFGGRVERRIDNDNGNLPLVGNAFPNEDGTEAILEITTPCENPDDIWRGGMFINTGIVTKANVTYTVSFDVTAENDEGYDVMIQKNQWGETLIKNLEAPKGHVSEDITITEGTAGDLWLYVRSGAAINRIVLSNLKVEEHLGAWGKDTFRIEDFYENHEGTANATLNSDRGVLTYHVDTFESTDWKQKITSPTFYINGSGGNYVVSFRAKATQPVEVVVAAPVLGGWDPTLFWSRITLSSEEQVYTLFCNNNASDRDYTIVFQFGSGNNLKYENVDIEISNVSVNLRNRELDG